MDLVAGWRLGWVADAVYAALFTGSARGDLPFGCPIVGDRIVLVGLFYEQAVRGIWVDEKNGSQISAERIDRCFMAEIRARIGKTVGSELKKGNEREHLPILSNFLVYVN